MLELRNQHLPVVLLHKINVHGGGKPERELANPAMVCDRKITLADDVHPNQDVRAGEIALCGTNIPEQHLVWCRDVYQVSYIS